MPIPPNSVSEIAKKALDKRSFLKKEERAGTAKLINLSERIAAGHNLGMINIERLISFYEKLEPKIKDVSEIDKHRQLWDLLGGMSGKTWAVTQYNRWQKIQSKL